MAMDKQHGTSTVRSTGLGPLENDGDTAFADLLTIAQAAMSHGTGGYQGPDMLLHAQAESIMRRQENRALAAWRAKQSPETIAKWGRWAQPQKEEL